jgi:hypothetical protein
MTELDEVAEAIHNKYPNLWPLTRKQAETLAWVELPVHEADAIVKGVADALMQFNKEHAP